MSNVNALKALAAKLLGSAASSIPGDTNAEVIQYIADNYTKPEIPESEFTPATSVSPVSAADATAPGEAYTQAEIQAIVTLANANKVAINAIIQALKDAGLMQ